MTQGELPSGKTPSVSDFKRAFSKFCARTGMTERDGDIFSIRGSSTKNAPQKKEPVLKPILIK